MSEALDLYGAHQAAKGNKPRTAATTLGRLRSFFDLGGEDDAGDELLVDVTTARCQRLYDRLAARVAVDTHRNTLGQVRTFFRWAKKRGYVRSNPLVAADGELTVEGEGRRRKGKKQLRIDEARRFRAAGLELAAAGDRGALAALLALLQGMRAEEVLGLTARDVDDGGRVLWLAADDVDEVKTERGRRALVVAPELVEPLRIAAAGGEDLFAGRTRWWLRRQVARLCRMAGAPRVCSHGLRGTHSSIGTEFGASALAVSMALGHTEKVNRESYTTSEAAGAAHQRRFADRLH